MENPRAREVQTETHRNREEKDEDRGTKTTREVSEGTQGKGGMKEQGWVNLKEEAVHSFSGTVSQEPCRDSALLLL